MASMKEAIFFERDGVLNPCEVRHNQQVAPLSLEQFRIHPEALVWLPRLKDAGYLLIATTNQPAISQGILSRREVDLMHAMLFRKLPLDDVLMCPYDDRTHPCHKPQPGMFLEAGFKWGIDLDRSFVVSDKWADAKAAQIAGCTSVLIRSPWNGNDHHDFVVPDLASAAQKILALRPQKRRQEGVLAV